MSDCILNENIVIFIRFLKHIPKFARFACYKVHTAILQAICEKPERVASIIIVYCQDSRKATACRPEEKPGESNFKMNGIGGIRQE